jgi:hypothetical protein
VTIGRRVTWDGRDYEVTGLADNGRHRAIAHIQRLVKLMARKLISVNRNQRINFIVKVNLIVNGAINRN